MSAILYNSEFKAMYIHIPKCGGVYTKELLFLYNFKSVLVSRPDHDLWNNNLNHVKYSELESDLLRKKSILEIRTKGVLRYYLEKLLEGEYIGKYIYENSENNKACANLPLLKEIIDNWDSIFKFCAKRNPYEKMVSAYKYCKSLKMSVSANYNFEEIFTKEPLMSDNEFFHFISCYDHLLLPDNFLPDNCVCKIDKFLDFRNLNTEIIGVLKHFGINKFHSSHIDNLRKNTIGNSNTGRTDFLPYYNEAVLKIVNEKIKNDLILFNIEPCHSLEELAIMSEQNQNSDSEFVQINKNLLVELGIDDTDLGNIELDNGLIISAITSSSKVNRVSEGEFVNKNEPNVNYKALLRAAISEMRTKMEIKNIKYKLFFDNCKGKNMEEMKVIQQNMGITMNTQKFKFAYTEENAKMLEKMANRMKSSGVTTINNLNIQKTQ